MTRGITCLIALLCALVGAGPAQAHDTEELRAPDDPRWGQQWSLYSANDADIDMPEAWEMDPSPGEGVTVAVVDTRVDAGHPDLPESILPEQDFVPARGCNTGQAVWTADHGTLIAGVIAAVRGNGVGIAGIAPEATILPVRAFDDCGAGNIGSVVSAFEYAGSQGAHVVVGSFSTEPLIPAERKRDYNRDLAAVLNRHLDTLFVVAAGNEGVADPARYPVYPCDTRNEDGSVPANLLCVGATDANDAPVCWSNQGAELYAPGTSILSTASGGTYRSQPGTSMSAAIVAGVAALLKGDGSASAAHVKQQLIDTADSEIPGLDGGRVNAAKALESPSRTLGNGGPGKSTPWVSCDTDHDGFLNSVDDCPNTAGTIRGCPDRDGDGVRDLDDNCPAVFNPDQADADRDGIGDACDPTPRGPDTDGDSKPNMDDRCPTLFGTGPDGCPPPIVLPPNPPVPTPVPRRPTTEPANARVVSVKVRTTPKRCPRARKRCSKSARVTVRMTRSAKLSLRIERRTKSRGRRVWRRVATRSLKATTSSRSLTVRRLKPGSYRVMVTVAGERTRRNFKV